MPAFAFLLDAPLDTSLTSKKLATLRTLGHPYSDAEVENAARDALAQADEIAAGLRARRARRSPTRRRTARRSP